MPRRNRHTTFLKSVAWWQNNSKHSKFQCLVSHSLTSFTKSPYLAFQVDFFQFILQVHETLKKVKTKKTSFSTEPHFRIIKWKLLLQIMVKEHKKNQSLYSALTNSAGILISQRPLSEDSIDKTKLDTSTCCTWTGSLKSNKDEKKIRKHGTLLIAWDIIHITHFNNLGIDRPN